MRTPWPRWLGFSFAGFGRDARPCGVCVHALVGEWLDMNKAHQPIYSPIMLHSQTLCGIMLSTYCNHDTNMILPSGGHIDLSSPVLSCLSLLCLSIQSKREEGCRGAYVSHICYKCFISRCCICFTHMLQVFHLDIAYVLHWLHMCFPGVASVSTVLDAYCKCFI
jgi:hypothetical protein